MLTRLSNKLATISLVIGAILLALMAGRAMSKRRAAQRKDERAADLLNSNISREVDRGKKLVEAAHKDKDKAQKAQEKMERQLEAMGQANEDLDAIVDRFNSKRLRK